MLNAPDIRFPNLDITLNHVGSGITIFGFRIAFYGIVIAIGMLVGFAVVQWQAKRTNQTPDLYLDFALYAIIISVIGARIYYVMFTFEDYKDNLWQIFNTRGGGLAIYGGVIGAVITAIVYSKIKKISFWLLADTSCVGLVIGQVIGRFGNFFNREAFGGYTNGLFAMQIKRADVAPSNVTNEILDHLVYYNGIEYIQVHPTFLYEAAWNLCLFIGLLIYTKHKKFDGEIVLIYFAVYGIGRALIESLRTDQLLLWGTSFAVSELLSIVLAITAITLIIIKRISLRKNKKK